MIICLNIHHFLLFGLLQKKKALYKCPDAQVWCEKWLVFDRIHRIKLLVIKELNFFYFFQIWPFTMCAFGRAFLPILTRQEGRKAEGRREKGEGRRQKWKGTRGLKKTSGSLPKACRDWRGRWIKSMIILFFLAKMTKNAQKGQKNDQKVLYKHINIWIPA